MSSLHKRFSTIMFIKKFSVVICFALLVASIPVSTISAAAPQRGTITFVNTDHTYTYKLYSQYNRLVARGTVNNLPVSRQFGIGIYTYEISHGDGRIERGQVSLASGQMILVTANLSTTTLVSAPGNTTATVNSGGTIAYDQGSSSTIVEPGVTTHQYGGNRVAPVGQVTSQDAQHGVDGILRDRIIPVTGVQPTAHQGAPAVQFEHGTNATGTTDRSYLGQTYQVQHAVGNVMCLSAAAARDFEMCRYRGTTSVVGVIDESGDVIFSGVEQIKVIGNVRYGDKLVASSTPGYAVVDNNARYGSVIGTALGSFTGQRGLVTARIGKG